jgi:hypothetical protein
MAGGRDRMGRCAVVDTAPCCACAKVRAVGRLKIPPPGTAYACLCRRCMEQALQQAEHLFEARHGKVQGSAMWAALLARVKELNMHELQPLAGTAQDLAAKCPMPQGCTL